MDRVVGYDYPIDNKEEMNMKQIRVEDFAGDSTEVSTSVYYDDIVTIDLDPDDQWGCARMSHYTQDKARKLTSALILAAEEAEKR